MSLKYHLVEKRDLATGAGEDDRLLYGQIKMCEEVTFQMVCDRIEHSSTATSGDVKSVLSSLMDVLKTELKLGHVVQMGELGRFRLSVGSKGVKTEKDFSTSLFRRPKIVFTPSTALKDSVSRVSYERLTAVKSGGSTSPSTEAPAQSGGGQQSNGNGLGE